MAENSQPPGGERGEETSASPASQVPTRRAEHATDTRVALIAAARRLFAAYGFDGTGTEQIVAEARVTRGALYHHFRDKADLFRAAMAEAAADVALRLTDEQLAAEAASPLDDIREGVSAFLDVCVGGDFQRIVLVDGPRVLGADAWEDLVDRYGRGLLEEWLSRAAATGDLDAVPVQALARLLIAMLTEASLAIARADDPANARADLEAVLDRMLIGLRPPGERALSALLDIMYIIGTCQVPPTNLRQTACPVTANMSFDSHRVVSQVVATAIESSDLVRLSRIDLRLTGTGATRVTRISDRADLELSCGVSREISITLRSSSKS